ncbi:hypothetical protein CBF30_09475 [Vagococcus entomophilus]|uniref:isochorismate synthase n=2 Tax=Vagococcus entomophilus TaxID=1160095 RepID=A0A430AFK5_9ENTE|nr:hypothetical protein CBF30_09475 [Vagococcus entomophilus]
MELPLEIKQAYRMGKRKFSWIEPLDKIESIVDFFYQGEQKYNQTRFFWETPDKALTLVGIEPLVEILTPTQDEQLLREEMQKITKDVWCNYPKEQNGYFFLGGLPFDKKKKAKKIWGELASGYFFIPKILIKKIQDQYFVAYNFQCHDYENLNEKWQEVHQLFYRLQQEPVESSKSHMLEQKELRVSEWLKLVAQTVQEIKTSPVLNKVVLARELAIRKSQPISLNETVKQLLREQKNTYIFALEKDGHKFVGATPERLLCATENTFATACVAGSIARGKNESEDFRLGQQLLEDQKNQQEHQYVVRYIEQILGHYTQEALPKRPAILLKNQDIQHLFVPFSGTRTENASFLEAVFALHPTPALGGVPQGSALEWISKKESAGRGMYGAPIGWIQPQSDSGEFVVAIRSAIIRENQALLYAGCGIVEDSIPKLEQEETKIKFRPMLRAIGGEIEC